MRIIWNSGYMCPHCYENQRVLPYTTCPMPHTHSFQDRGPHPLVLNIQEAAKLNSSFRTTLWTGRHFQVTLMSLNAGEDIGAEVHYDVDQFLYIEEGEGTVVMGESSGIATLVNPVTASSAIVVPAGTWHNLINTGSRPMKLYSLYAPPEHPFGTVHHTKADDMQE